MELPERPPPSFKDAELELRLVSKDDWPLEQALSQAPDVVRWTTIPAGLTEEAAKERVQRAESHYRAGAGARYVVERYGGGCGQVGIAAAGDGRAEVFYALLPAACGFGTATRSVQMLIGWATSVGIEEVLLHTFPDNEASQRTAQRCGFQRSGRTVRAIHGVDTPLMTWSHHGGGTTSGASAEP